MIIQNEQPIFGILIHREFKLIFLEEKNTYIIQKFSNNLHTCYSNDYQTSISQQSWRLMSRNELSETRQYDRQLLVFTYYMIWRGLMPITSEINMKSISSVCNMWSLWILLKTMFKCYKLTTHIQIYFTRWKNVKSCI